MSWRCDFCGSPPGPTYQGQRELCGNPACPVLEKTPKATDRKIEVRLFVSEELARDANDDALIGLLGRQAVDVIRNLIKVTDDAE